MGQSGQPFQDCDRGRADGRQVAQDPISIDTAVPVNVRQDGMQGNLVTVYVCQERDAHILQISTLRYTEHRSIASSNARARPEKCSSPYQPTRK
jgi:hypothetical protein